MNSANLFSVLAICCTLLSACNKGPECNLPAASKMEMITLGATYTTYCGYRPENIIENTYGSDEIFVTANMTLYFSPHPEHLDLEFKENESSGPSTERYLYTYSQFISGEFIEIPAVDPTFTSPTDNDQYSSRVYLSQGPSELIVVGNHYINTYNGGFASIPVRATHTELWFYESPGSARELVRRVPLESLNIWKRYIKPIVDGAKL